MARLPTDENSAPQDEIAYPAAFNEALALLTPNNDPEVAGRFSELFQIQSLLVRNVIGSASLPILKKGLFESAHDVAKISENLYVAIARYSKLAQLPVSLVVANVDVMQRDLLELPKLMKHVVTINEIANRSKAEFEKIAKKRKIYPWGSVGNAFDNKLTELWQLAGHKITSSTDGLMAQYFALAYQAVTGKERKSVSRPLGNALKYRESAQRSERQKLIAGSGRHKAAFDKIAMERAKKRK